ncbi:acetate/CoA ligase [Dehalogenimonas lykanthroporepellens BL-DC-9]|jgi:acetyl-CoA synthetase|nr:acetate/CoA ligase [Dehalogenimonas lykanthroporepellens BL-DC-9]
MTQTDSRVTHLPTGSYYNPTGEYDEMYRRSLEDPEGFWAEQAESLDWFKPWEKVLDWKAPYARWFVGGKLNLSYQCLDRHMKTETRNKVAFYWEGELGDSQVLTYHEMYRLTNNYAAALKRLGVNRGDKVALYLPMIPALPVFMLACARIGAIFTVVFSAFSGQALADRVEDVNAKVIITASGMHRRGKILPLKDNAVEAAGKCPCVEKIVVVKHTGHHTEMDPKRDVWLDDILSDTDEYVAPEEMDSNDPLFVLYTSGSTGKPKGILHGTAGYSLWIAKTLQWAFNPGKESVFWCTADIGWITGHSYVVFAPLELGLTSVMYEGAPDYPGIDRWWQLIAKYGVTIFYTSPTAIRMFMRHGEEWPAKYDLSSLKSLGSVGEPINPEAWLWYYRNIGHERIPISDTWWQTETGGFMISPTPGIQPHPLKPGSATKPMPGVDVAVLDPDGKELPNGQTGFIVIRKPWPGMLLDIYNNQELYEKTYWSRFPGNYLPGDFCMRDQDNFLWLLGRADEVIKVAGHRISTAELESSIVGHSAVAEAAACSRPDEVKGEAIILFVTLRKGTDPSPEIKAELTRHLRATIGALATPEEIFFVNLLPKTRSGKIMRRLLKAVATGATVGDTSTLDDGASIDEARAAFDELKNSAQRYKTAEKKPDIKGD